MIMKYLILTSVILLSACANTEQTAIEAVAIATSKAPTNSEAKKALDNMFGPEVAELMKNNSIVLGTCIATPAKYAPRIGQFSCTFLLKSPGGSSESQADFYLTKDGWVAQPSASQDELPFPDPALQ
jgi:hypothetical protein